MAIADMRTEPRRVRRRAAAGVTVVMESLLRHTDPKQELRLRRYMQAAATSLLVLAVLSLCALAEVVPGRLVVEAGAIIGSLMLAFYLLIRTGLNRRLPDPSLTTEMLVAASATMLYVLYQADQAREILLLVLLMPFLFGAYRLKMRTMLVLSLLVLAGYAGMISLALELKPQLVDRERETAVLVVLAMVLPWFALMGGHMGGVRDQVHRTNRQLQQAIDTIHEIAIHDELTGVFNRRYLMEALRQERARSERGGALFCLCLMDIDHFKKVNDTFGHAVGDEVLRQFASVVQNCLRTLDVFGRYGGEEFLLILPQTLLEGAMSTAERIRSAVEAAEFAGLPGGQRVTVSIGVTLYRHGEEISRTLARVDEGLYGGKAGGRNRVVSPDSVPAEPSREEQSRNAA